MMAKRRGADPKHERQIQRAFYERHRERRCAEVKAHREKHRDRINACGRARRAANRDEINARHRTPEQRAKRAAYARKRREMPEHRLRNVLNARLAFCVKYPDRPIKSFIERFGYTPAELRTHLELQFVKGMSWDSYGLVWHVDHIRPVSSFKLPEEIRACWALSNLRPLFAEKNQAKGAKRTYLL
jgi:hypothetical protein